MPAAVAPLILFGILLVAALGLLTVVVYDRVEDAGGLFTPVSLWRSWRRRLRRVRRYSEVLRIVRRHGLWRSLRGMRPDRVDAATAESIVAAINDAGVTFIKMGQMLATGRDGLSPALRAALSSLQTAAVPEPLGTMKAIVADQLDIAVDEVFERFDPEPFAAASIAQVHAARLRDGRDVVVKVQRPGAADRVAVDGDILLRLARLADTRTRWGHGVGILRVARDFVRSLRAETDFETEVFNTRLMAAALADDDRVEIPEVVSELTRGTVITMTRVTGGPIDPDASSLGRLDGEARTRLAWTVLRVVLRGVLVDGVFHGDLHPGNIHLTDDDRIGLLDFGVVGCLDAETRMLLTALLYAISSDDNVAAVDALLMIAEPRQQVNVQSLRREVGEVITRLRFHATMDVYLENTLVEIVRHHGLSLPGQVLTALKSISSLERTLTTLDPDFVILDAAQEVSGEILRELAGPRRLARLAIAHSAVGFTAARRLPERLERSSAALADGRLAIHTRMLGHGNDRAWIQWLLSIVAGVILALVAIVTGIALVLAPSSTASLLGVSWSAWTGLGLTVVGAVAGLWTTAAALARTRRTGRRGRG